MACQCTILAIINGSYMTWLQSSHHLSIYVRNIKGNHIPVVYIYIKTISVNTSALHKNVCDYYTKTSICNIKNFI